MQLNGRKVDWARVEQAWIVRARTSLPVPVSPVMRTGTLVGAMRRATAEDALHLLGEEDGAALTFDGIGRPQRGAVALLLAGVLQRERGATEAKNVA